MKNNTQIIRQSILDRLIDEDPANQQEIVKPYQQQLTDYIHTVRRDLENLLNTRNVWLDSWQKWEKLNISLLTYGVPDFIHNGLITSGLQAHFCCEVANIIRRFEPRFKTVQVTIVPGKAQPYQLLRVRIEGLLYVQSALEPVLFDAINIFRDLVF